MIQMPGASAMPSMRDTPALTVPDDPIQRAAPDRIRVWAILRSMLAIAIAKRALRRRGLTHTLGALRDRYDHEPGATEVDPLAIVAADRVVALAAAFYPGRAHCLERSLVLYERLSRLGAAPEFRLGVQAAPFAAHAWIELDGTPVNDCAEHVAHFAVVPDAQP